MNGRVIGVGPVPAPTPRARRHAESMVGPVVVHVVQLLAHFGLRTCLFVIVFMVVFPEAEPHPEARARLARRGAARGRALSRTGTRVSPLVPLIGRVSPQTPPTLCPHTRPLLRVAVFTGSVTSRRTRDCRVSGRLSESRAPTRHRDRDRGTGD